MQRYTIYLFLNTALHVSGGTSTHHQEHIQLYLQHLVLVRPLQLYYESPKYLVTPVALSRDLRLKHKRVHHTERGLTNAQ